MNANLTASAPSSPVDARSLTEARSGPPAWVWDLLAYAPIAGAAAALTVGAAALLGKGPRLLRRRRPVAALVAAGGWHCSSRRSSNAISQSNPYVLEGEVNGLELRRYAPRLVAETVVDGSFDAAREEGFRRLAGYIFGKNHKSASIAMTAPVNIAASDDGGERIAMTAPVNITRAARSHVVTFTMPRDKTLDSLPTPRDARITVRETPATRVAVLRTRGSYSGERIEAKMRELLERVRVAGLTVTGAVAFAGYDAPSTLPALRRVELWVPVT